MVIDLLDKRSLRHGVALKALQIAEREWFGSDLLRMECLIRPLRTKDELSVQKVFSFFSRIECLEIPSTVFDDAAAIRADLGLKTPDAIHLAVALHYGCEEFWTNDVKLGKADANIVFRSYSLP